VNAVNALNVILFGLALLAFAAGYLAGLYDGRNPPARFYPEKPDYEEEEE
jgi:hypothetical protein